MVCVLFSTHRGQGVRPTGLVKTALGIDAGGLVVGGEGSFVLSGQLQCVTSTMPGPRSLWRILECRPKMVQCLTICTASECGLAQLNFMGSGHKWAVCLGAAAPAITGRELAQEGV